MGTTRRKALAASGAAMALAALGLAGVGVVVPAGVAGALTTAPAGALSATGSPLVPSTGTGSAAGSVTVDLGAAGSLPTGETLQLFLSSSTNTGTIDWGSFTVSTTGIAHSTIGKAGNGLDIVLGAKPSGTAATIQVSSVQVSTSGARGSVVATPTLALGGVTFSPASVSIGTIFPTPPAPPAVSLTSSATPQLSPGETSGPAATWTLTLSGNPTTQSGWVAGDAVVVTVAPPSGTNCTGGAGLSFATTPAAQVVSSSGLSASPTVSASVTNGGPCGTSAPNELVVELTDSAWFEQTGSVTIAVSGVRYTVGPTATADGAGPVDVTATYLSTAVGTSTAANALVGGVAPAADTPPVTVVPAAYAAPISPVDVVESSVAHVQAGTVCLTLSAGSFDPTSPAAVAVAAGDGEVGPAVTFQGTTGTGPPTAAFDVTLASTTAGTYRVSGLEVDAPVTPGPVDVAVTEGPGATCTADTGSIGSAVAFAVASTAMTRVWGQTDDVTAAAELEHQFGASGTACPGRPGARPVVLATDATYQDSLAGAYLAGVLGTGELLTPKDVLATAAADAIHAEGITSVYIVGGPLAVSQTVQDQLTAMTADTCGGTGLLTPASPVHLTVTRIYGQTAYDTAQWIAEYPTASDVGTISVPGAYAGTNATGGAGRYNATTGNASAAPATTAALPTAIVATGKGFQDAESASVLSYADHLPILLTTPTSLSTQVASAISALHITQVIVMGGPLAVSDGVVSSLEQLGVSVLRIAGQTFAGTGVELADFELGSRSGSVGLGWAGTGGLTVARGDFYTDGLAGAVVEAGAGTTHAHGPQPLVLTIDPATLGGTLGTFLGDAGRVGIDGISADRVSRLTLLGGPLALTTALAQTMETTL